MNPAANHPGFVEHSTPWGTFTALATDEIHSIEPASAKLPEDSYPFMDDILAALGGVKDVDHVGTGRPPLKSAVWLARSGTPFHLGIGSDYGALFPRELFQTLGPLDSRYPVQRFPNLLLAVDEVFRYQGRERDRALDPDNYDRRNEAPGKLFHEQRDASDPIAQEISRVTGCAWPWFAGDDITGDGVNYVMNEAITRPSLLDHCVTQPDGSRVSYAEAVVAGIMWQLRRMVDSGRWLILSTRSQRPPNSDWMPPIGSVWKDSPDSFLRLDGTLPVRSTALVEVQCILYRSLRLAARVSQANSQFANLLGQAIHDGLGREVPTGLAKDNRRLEAYLNHLAGFVRTAFFDTFWVNNDAGGFPGYFAELDEAGRKLVVAPVLASGVIDSVQCGLYDGEDMKERLHAVMRNIYDPAYGLRGALGPRSLGKFSPHYSPSGWAGSIWPHMNDKAAAAAARCGFHRCAYHDSLLVYYICVMTRSTPEFVVDSDRPAIEPVRVKAWRSQPERHLTTAIEPAKPWQLWTLGALTNSWQRAADHEQHPRQPPSDDVAKLDAELAENLRAMLPTLPPRLRPSVVWTGREQDQG